MTSTLIRTSSTGSRSTDTTLRSSQDRGVSTAPHRTSGAVGALNAEWEILGARPAPEAWGSRSALADHATPGALLDHHRATPAAHDAILHALLTLAHDGDTLAARTVLQAMLGKVVRLSRTAAARGLDDPIETTIAAAWETIAGYPLHRTAGIAGRLALDTLHRIPQPNQRTTPVDHPVLEGLTEPVPPLGSGEPEDPTEQLTQLLIWAQQTGTLATAEIQLLARKYLSADVGVTLAEIAAETGQPLGTLCSRHHRAIATLVKAVAADSEGDR